MAEPVNTSSTHLDSSSPLPFPIPNFGNGFVEVSALTTFIGSSVTESLVLGNEGGAGVAWATMSAFGLMGAVKACVGAASPGWLRSAVGARSGNTDAAIGMEVASNERGRGAMKVRRSYGEKGPTGLSVDASVFLKLRGKPAASELKIKWQEIYALDKLTSRGLGGFPDNKLTSDIVPETITHRDPRAHLDRRNVEKPSEQIDATPAVYFYSVNPFHSLHDPWFQVPVLLLSTAKLGESLVLWQYGAGFLGFITVIPWAYFFLVACIIESREIIVARRPEVLDGEIDIIVGQFPNMTQFAESPQRNRVVIGAPRNPRKTIWWKAAWILGALICPPVTAFIYLSLAQQSNEIVILWLAFQAIWMVGRMLVHHYAESPSEAIAPRILYRKSWETLPDIFRKRVVNLMVALSTYVISVHPRQEHTYRDNVTSSQELRRVVIETPTISNYPLSPKNEPMNSSNYVISNRVRVDVEIHAIIGDPTLISAAWLANTPGLTFESLYDTCILCLKAPFSIITSQYVTIPCVRFVTAIAASETPAFDEETNQPLDSLPQFFPKGRPHDGPSTWWYLIPAEKEQWLLIKQDVLSPALGKHSAELMSDEGVTAVLSRGNLLISIANVDEVRSALKNSQKAMQTLVEILS